MSSTQLKLPVSIIFDTDMGNDIDDALALAMLHALQSRGECRLLGVIVSKDNPFAPAYADVVNTFYRRGRIPIGVVRDGVTPDDRTFIRPIVTARDGAAPRYPRTAASHDDYHDAVTLLRRLLARAADRGITVVMVGFSTNMARLLDTPADDLSELDGRELFARKVERVVMMAGEFSPAVLADPSSKLEYNVVNDTASAQRFIAACPAPIVFTGLEVGRRILYPAASIDRDFAWCDHHPVAEAYKLYLPMPYDRPTWDLTAVLYAARPDHGYFGVSQPGTARVGDDGSLHFTPDAAGRCRYLTADDAQCARVARAQVRLVTQPTDCVPSPATTTLTRRKPAPIATSGE